MLLDPLPERPRISVVIPCRDERGYIGRCLASLERAAHEVEEVCVIVVDGMSTDGTREEIHAFTQRLSWMQVVDNPARTTPKALNLGLRARPFDIGIILGAHAEVESGFLSGNVAALRGDREAGCAGGIILNEYSDARGRRIGMAMAHPFGVGNAYFRTGTRAGHVDTVAFGAYRRELFDVVGWFDEALVRNQDDEFNHRVTSAGFKILLDPTIRSRYHVRASFGKLHRQYHQYGYWKVYVNRKHRTVTTLRQLAPAAWLAWLLGGLVMVFWLPVLWGVWATGLLLYAMVALVAAVQAAHRAADLPGVLRAFLVLHLAYGLGYWKGIVHFLLLGQGPASSSHRSTR